MSTQNGHTDTDPLRPLHFPTLPIVTPDSPAPKRTAVERFGGMFTLGIVGLVVMVGLVGWFGWSVWALRDVWSNVYVLHDTSRPEKDRIQAAYDLSRNPKVNARQLWDIALERRLPPLARYLIAEALPAAATEDDPRGYVLAVARSEGWPEWLRVLLARPIAYEASEGGRFPREPLEELAKNPDPAVALWAVFALARPGDEEARIRLRVSAGQGSFAPVAEQLLIALDATTPAERTASLDAATLWLREHHPASVSVWKGWRIKNARVEPDRDSASELH
jgi:hypothetical protein